MKRDRIESHVNLLTGGGNVTRQSREAFVLAVLNSYPTEMWLRHVYANDLRTAVGKYLPVVTAAGGEWRGVSVTRRPVPPQRLSSRART